MSTTDIAGAGLAFEASPTVAAVVTSPKLLLKESLAGIMTALALIPEVIAFSFISGVDPKVALVASVVLCFTMSVLGGRPAMVTAAAGSVALVLGPMVRAHGVPYILPAIVLAGSIQFIFGIAGLARLTRFIPRSVMIGFVNALGILIFTAQLPHIMHVPVAVYWLLGITVVTVVAAPRLTSAVPSPLIAIILCTVIAVFGHLTVPTVGDHGMASGLPGITALLVPLNLDTLKIVWPTALSVAFVGLLETLLTTKLVDETTETKSNKGKESWALGVANILAAFFGGVGGCAMIAQTVMNVKIGGARTRVSTIVAALFMLVMVTVLSKVLAMIPIVALAGVMMIVALKTINWHSIKPATLKRLPVPETMVMVLTVVITVATGNLAIGIVTGVLVEILLFARRSAHVIRVERDVTPDGATVQYNVHGPLFFGSSNDLVDHFKYGIDPRKIVIDLSLSQIWDASTVAALDSIKAKYEGRGSSVSLVGLNERSLAFYGRLAGQL
jgi:SulP family sulfate permease